MKRFLKNKQAHSDTWVTVGKWWYYVLVIFITTFAIILYAGKGYSFVQSKATTPLNLEEDILIAQLVNVCFVYEDENGRSYQNVLDIKKLTESTLDSCIYDSAAVTISSINGDFDALNLQSGSTTVKTTFSRYVLVKTDQGLYPATITVIL